MPLSSHLQQGVADTLRWSALRDVQRACVEPTLAGENLIVLAPTAGGKTEAALLPALDVLLREPGEGVRLLYLSPLTALLNDQEPRVQRLAALAGLDAMSWHGSVSGSLKRQFLREPAQVLLTTPESLEGLLRGGHAPHLFRDLRFVVVDELHALAASERGAQLGSVLHRLTAHCVGDVQRIGLSATVQNPALLGAWLRGHSARPGRVIRPQSAPTSRAAHLLQMPSPDAALSDLAQRMTGRKILLFTESRAGADQAAVTLRHLKPQIAAAPYHAGLTRDQRAFTEEQLRSSQEMTVCSTSALELGLDIGDVDEVVQWRPARTVSSLLQRWGRSGRRAGSPARLTVYTFNPWETLEVAAQLNLAQRGEVEPVVPSARHFPVLVQQMLCASLYARHTPESLWNALQGAPPFTGILTDEYRQLLRHLLSTGLLTLVQGELVVGEEAERQFGFQSFRSLLTAFDAPDEYTVVDQGAQMEVGRIAARQLPEVGGTFLLAGRAWTVVRTDQAAGQVIVAVAHVPAVSPGGQSAGRDTSFTCAQEQLALLCGGSRPEQLNAAAHRALDDLGKAWTGCRPDELTIDVQGAQAHIHTFAGHQVNKLLAELLSPFGKVTADGQKVTVQLTDSTSLPALTGWLQHGWQALSAADMEGALARCLPPATGRFARLLPEDLAQSFSGEQTPTLDHLRLVLARTSAGRVGHTFNQ
ncbi:DEAD/DEAH box helicase [Deinococcus sp. 12RED42]|uniref:DEAD/DEAH box helicase n=1 Tax=Deinococcus sp. 12RED42 TaxID=2745872 RepID=UPI001E505113|nr:DEAD/DEAH box helicase [Deinococcus sp. 12RED42]MCD0164777.1 DEAD/DEAH box helicase [Deinococcus sp. 12RED42]